ncbi:hypothetical protein RvY_15292 [Ramazzottius varieornatus]|uniref:Uncharacterized protein n=1 Tax=Ramazzottius varieornatus TaxID=947166 RepID=A0A1D1VW03_RAMVA|nr:hypothetical protein RvY_15292 [Ramazzottius varieornatus]
MVALVTVIGLFLQPPFSAQAEEETDADFAQRIETITRRTYWEWSSVSIALTNGTVKVAACLYCSDKDKSRNKKCVDNRKRSIIRNVNGPGRECSRSMHTQVKKILRLLRTVRDENQGTEIEDTCMMILSEIDESTGAIAAAGLKYINLEYVAETRDATIGDGDNVKTKDLYRLMAYLEEVAHNESEILVDFIQQRFNVTQ